MHIKLFFPRWRFSYNLGDTVMLSCLFKAIREFYQPDRFEVISDKTVVDLFRNDPYVDHFRAASWLERKTIKFYKDKEGRNNPVFLVWPEWDERVFDYLKSGNNLQRMIDHPRQNILSLNYSQLINPKLLEYDDLRPRIHLLPEEIAKARQKIPENAIALHIARIRSSQKRDDGESLRFRLVGWKQFIATVKKHDPNLKVYEVGSEQFFGIGDEHIAPGSIRELAAQLHCVRLVVLSDGGIHSLCNAIDKTVLIFQGYEWNPPDVFKMGNALFNESIHLECRKRCHIFSDILNIKQAVHDCNKECYKIDPLLLAKDCIGFLSNHNPETS